MQTSEDQRTTLYSAQALEPVLDAMAATLCARLHGVEGVTLVGVLRRGAPLADMLLPRLQSCLPTLSIERLDVSIKRYADDLTLLHPQTQLMEQAEQVQMDLSHRVVVIVDDVLYFGFSLFKAAQYLISKGAQTLHTVVLADRACASLPIHADVCGLTLEVAPGQIVECHVPPYEPTFQIVLVQPAHA